MVFFLGACSQPAATNRAASDEGGAGTSAAADAGRSLQGYAVAGPHLPLIPPDGRLFKIRETAVSCFSPGEVGLARTVYPHMAGSANLTRAFDQTHCFPPMGPATGDGTTYQLHHFEDVTWRASLDDGLTWVGGPLRVAELRAESDGQQMISYVAADDLIPVAAAAPDSPPAPAATANPQ